MSNCELANRTLLSSGETIEAVSECDLQRKRRWNRLGHLHRHYSLDDSVDFVENVSDLVVGVLRRQLQLQDQSIDFVDANRHRQSFLQGMLQQSLGVEHYPLGGVDKE